MKEVSFKIAKAIKKAGYPQDRSSNCYNAYTGEFHYTSCSDSWLKDGDYIDAPTYLDAWLWLWREKKIAIGCPHENTYNYWFTNINAENDKSLILWKYSSGECNDPEEAIISAIDYLVDNDLIK